VFALRVSPSRNGEAAAAVSSDQVAAYRLDRHHLVTRAVPEAIPKVAGDMAGVQAQVMSAARMSLWARTRNLEVGDVEDALWRDRTLAKTWCMRGTTHLVPSEDIAVFVGGCARRANRSLEWIVRAGMSLETIDRIADAVRKVLDRPRTRKEAAPLLSEALGVRMSPVTRGGWGGGGKQEGLEFNGEAWSVGSMLYLACVRGIACAGPENGNEATYVRTDAWLTRPRELSVEEAESELLRRYLHAYGPATVADFAWWTYMKAADAREVWAREAPGLAAVDVDGRPGWIPRSDLRSLERASIDAPVVRLLPYFDAYLLGHKNKAHLVDAAHYTRVYRPAGWLSPVVLVDGRIAGVWSYARKGKRLAVRVEPFTRLGPSIRSAIHDEAEDLGRFLDLPDVRVSFTGGGRGPRPFRGPTPPRPRARGSRGARGPPSHRGGPPQSGACRTASRRSRRA